MPTTVTDFSATFSVFVYLVGHNLVLKEVKMADYCERIKRYILSTYEEIESHIHVIEKLNVTQAVAIIDFYGPNMRRQLSSPCLRLWADVPTKAHAHYPLLIYRTYIINSNV